MKRYIKRKVKHKTKLYLTRVSVQQMKKQHSETKRSMKRRKKENRNTYVSTLWLGALPSLVFFSSSTRSLLSLVIS